MESSAYHVSFIDQSASSIHLVVKQNQNMIVDLDASKYSMEVQPLIECLNHSILKKALTHHEDVPLSTLILAYSTTNYNKKMNVMSFEVKGHKTTITKVAFCKLLGLRIGEMYSNPNRLKALTSSVNL
ncbi:unnamed protein product [Lactuca saligna]|uniref:Uncharacterized protein n=1 Tax=Lactuca saligna TaxID=75948 RepID=A0AA36EHE8_LACSI|nr:unnamed protein product [Lactuca saligna]